MRLTSRRLRTALTLTNRDGIMLVAGAIVAVVLYGVYMMTRPAPAVLTYRPAGVTAAWIPLTVRRWDAQIHDMARRYDIDANLVAIVITLESGGDPKARSEVGASGLMQIMPATAADIASRYIRTAVEKYDLEDPGTNIEFGTAYLAMLRDEFGTPQHGPDYTRSVELIATGYNAGGGTAAALERGEGLRDPQPVIYARDAFNMWRERVSATSPTYERWKERGGDKLLEAAERR